jgi:hypothetical protein
MTAVVALQPETCQSPHLRNSIIANGFDMKTASQLRSAPLNPNADIIIEEEPLDSVGEVAV